MKGRLLVGLVLIAMIVAVASFRSRKEADDRTMGPPVASARKVDPNALFVMTVPGELQTARNTLIECEVENIGSSSGGTSGGTRSGGGGGNRGGGGGGRGGNSNTGTGLMVISIVPQGSFVREGEVLCEIDSSSFVELARQQRIAVETAMAAEAKARCDMEAAEIALAEYVEGVRPQTVMVHESQVSVAEADLQRQKDHLDWTRRVRPLGYVAPSAFRDELISTLTFEIALDQAAQALSNYVRYTQPKMIRQLESQLEQMRATYLFARRNRELAQGLFEAAQRQVDHCMIRAPHDGYVIYCQTRDGQPLQAGSDVYRNMDLFRLPDLSKLEVEATVNQSLIWRVAEGQRARVRLDALPDEVLEGRIVQVSPLPESNDRIAQVTGVNNYKVRIELDGEGDERLLPGLSAAVDVLIPADPEALVIPSRALTVEDRQPTCYVAGPAGPERRPVTVRPGSIDRLQVLEGLEEGERVVLTPFDVAL